MRYLWCLLALLAPFGYGCELVMGYRTNDKAPLINEAPNSNGLYFDVYQEATKRIGCNLRVKRLPKNRVLNEIRRGTIDFYPGLSFTEERHQYIHFFNNGLQDGYVGITRKGEPQITDLAEIAKRKLVMVVSHGGFDLNAKDYGIDVRTPHDMSLSDLVNFIEQERADFHAYNMLSVYHYLTGRPEWPKTITIHPQCCGGLEPMQIGFSKKSQHIRLAANPQFQADQPLSFANQPLTLAPSKALDLAKAIEQMQDDGTINELMRVHFPSMSTITELLRLEDADVTPQGP